MELEEVISVDTNRAEEKIKDIFLNPTIVYVEKEKDSRGHGRVGHGGDALPTRQLQKTSLEKTLLPCFCSSVLLFCVSFLLPSVHL